MICGLAYGAALHFVSAIQTGDPCPILHWGRMHGHSFLWNFDSMLTYSPLPHKGKYDFVDMEHKMGHNNCQMRGVEPDLAAPCPTLSA